MYRMLIDGSLTTGSSHIGVINPATEERFAESPSCTAAELEQTMQAAHDAYTLWSRAPEVIRREALAASADIIEASADELAELLTLEQGKPLRDARAEVSMTVLTFRAFSTLEVDSAMTFREDASTRVQLVRRARGVVAAITPWNFPLVLAARKLAPALLAGNCVVLKPSPYTPLSSLAMGEKLCAVFPRGVLSVITGGDQLGPMMTSHPIPRHITFTGSTATGKIIAAAAAADLKRVTLELGGNDPAIVMEDADIATIAPRIFASAFVNCGQVCSAIKRVYAPPRLRDELVDALVDHAQRLKVGNGLEDEIDMGPLNNAPQLERVTDLVDDARAHGASIATGGERLARVGYFFQPTVVTDVDDGVRLVDEEQFGPVLPIITYDGVEDVIARANATELGLDASLWGTDLERIAQIAPQLECGTVWMNVHGARPIDQPTGGLKSSGIGLENGKWGYEELTDLQVLYEVHS